TVTDAGQQGLRALHRTCGVLFAGQQWHKQGNDLVANELVQEAVVVEHGLGRGIVEVTQQALVFARRHPLRHGGGAAHVSKQHRHGNLGAAVVLVDEREAGAAQVGVVLRRLLAEHPHERPPDAAERRRAQPAARVRRNMPIDGSVAALSRIAVREEVAPEVLVRTGRRLIHHCPTRSGGTARGRSTTTSWYSSAASGSPRSRCVPSSTKLASGTGSSPRARIAALDRPTWPPCAPAA